MCDHEITDVVAELGVGDQHSHPDVPHQLLVMPGDTTEPEPGWLSEKVVTLKLANGHSMARIALDADQARQLRAALALPALGESGGDN